MDNPEYIDSRPVSFLDIIAEQATVPQKYYWARLAYQVTLIVTQSCNMRCTYCYDKSRIEKTNLKKTELTSIDFVKIIEEARSIGIRQIKITGGEPFLKKGIEDILSACAGINLYLCTNGTFLKEKMPLLASIPFEKLHIHSSLDGMESHVKYARNGTTALQLLTVMKEIKQCIPNVHIGVNTVINKENIYEFLQMYDALVEAGIDKWTISIPYIVTEVVRCNHPFPDFDELATTVSSLLKKHFNTGETIHLSIGCFYKQEMFDIKTIPEKHIDEHPCMPNCNGARGIIIDSFGNMLDCLLENPSGDTSGNIAVGSLLDTNIVCNRPFYQVKIGQVKNCLNCRYIRLCGTGCRYNAKVVFGAESEIRPDPIRCSCYSLMEKYILPILDHVKREKMLSYIDLKGNNPTFIYKNVSEIPCMGV
jgi:radical SAM protein with 4Fe4S-binding SPASM domain